MNQSRAGLANLRLAREDPRRPAAPERKSIADHENTWPAHPEGSRLRDSCQRINYQVNPRRPSCLSRPTRLPTPQGSGHSRSRPPPKRNSVGFFDVKGVTVPAAVSTFPHEIYQVPRSWAERAYPNLIYFNALDRGNHFAAWQEPDLFTTEVRAAFRSLR